MAQWTGTWSGGRTWQGRDGRPGWSIYKMVNGVRYSLALNVDSEADAVGELALFRRDPAGYASAHRTAKRPAAPALAAHEAVLNAENLAKFFHDRCHADDPSARITRKHANDTARYLRSWLVVLNGKPLNKVTLAEYTGLLDDLEPRRQHIAALRAFTHWLRSRGWLSKAEDPSMDLTVPQTNARRAVADAGRAGYELKDVEALYRNITAGKKDGGTAQAVRDVVRIKMASGMHLTEIARVAKGEVAVRKLPGSGKVAGVAVFIHKKGLPHPQSLGAEALAAVERLRARGRAPDDRTVLDVLERAARAAELEGKFTHGGLRHTFITLAGEVGVEVRPLGGGVSLDTIRRVVGHTSVSTTSLYDGAVPPMVELPIRLWHPDDPVTAVKVALRAV